MTFQIGDKTIGPGQPVYFVADIGANHDGSLARAKSLISLAADSGADAAKFQNFRAPRIVSRHGFDSLQIGHQAQWPKSVYDTYDELSLPWDWVPSLKDRCDKVGIEFMSTPYDLEAVDMLDPYVRAFKIGSGDITWIELIEKVASKGKPLFLGCGASEMEDIIRAVRIILKYQIPFVLMQCNTNYTGQDSGNVPNVNLNVLRSLGAIYPEATLGLSDHTLSDITTLGAVALGGRVIEKHITDDRIRSGPDHRFSLLPQEWLSMIVRVEQMSSARGSGIKRVEDNETETHIIQRRCLCASVNLKAGQIIERDHLIPLRPCPKDGLPPYAISAIIGAVLKNDVVAGQHMTWTMLESISPRLKAEECHDDNR